MKEELKKEHPEESKEKIQKEQEEIILEKLKVMKKTLFVASNNNSEQFVEDKKRIS